MRKSITRLILGLFLLSGIASADMVVSPTALPQNAQNFIHSNFKDVQIMYVEQDFDSFEVRLSNGVKIDFYRDKIRKIGDVGLIIKPHPRENTDYVKAFPHIPVFKKKIPLEILTLFGITFKYAYTVNSTSIFDLPSQTERIVWDKEFKVTSF